MPRNARPRPGERPPWNPRGADGTWPASRQAPSRTLARGATPGTPAGPMPRSFVTGHWSRANPDPGGISLRASGRQTLAGVVAGRAELGEGAQVRGALPALDPPRQLAAD